MKTLQLEQIVFRSDLYPRIETSAVTVQKYTEDLSVLPPIEVNQNNELIDGWHRWTAHKKAEAKEITVVVTKTKSDAELLELAIERNAKHGMQLSQRDKKGMATRIYNGTPDKERDDCKKRLATILSVPDRTIRDWLSRIDKDAKEERDRRIFDLWLACWTQQEIADEIGVTQGEIAKSIPNGDIAILNKSERAAAEHATDFDPPIYNVWKQQEKTKGNDHFGNSEVRWLDNLLYLYTSPFDVVIDPFAGGGSTIDLCRKRFRRYFVSDRKPIVEREKEIRSHDVVTDGLPKPPQWKDVNLVYLDPPYWKQAENKYSKDKTDLANMDLDAFHDTCSDLIGSFAKKLSGSVIALLMQPTQWNSPKHEYTDHVAEMIRRVKLPIIMRVQCPYESQQCNAQMVDWAKEQKQILVLSRELVVWRIE